MFSFTRSLGAGASGLALAFGLTAGAAGAVSVTLNGADVPLSPPPIEKAGRVFVPLRGVFEKLGASVVYQGGVINATGSNGNRIGLQIGSTNATVNGAAQQLDVAPFIVGASTYVPLRFISQALGAGVNFDGTNQIVALSMGAPGPNGPPPQGPPQVAVLQHVFASVDPQNDSTVRSTRPTISASFRMPVDPNSVRLMLDGLDITGDASRSTSGFVYAPPSPLQSMRHVVAARGRTADGHPFEEHFAFNSGDAAPANSLSLRGLEDGGAVPAPFVIRGRTAPNAHVHIIAGASVNAGGFAFGTGSYAGDTVADGNGDFSQEVTLQTVSGATIGLTVTSTDPVTHESAEKKLHLRAQ